jgi:glycine cleavage system regulatory protein
MIELVLTIIGRDRAGVVAELADVVRFHEANWKRSELAEISGTFAGVVVVDVDDDQADELLANLLVLRQQGLHITAEVIDAPVEAPDAQQVRFRFTGDDRPGILHEVSTTISGFGISISRMGSVLDTSGDVDQFEITTLLAVPFDVDLDAVLDAVTKVSESLGINLHVEDLTDVADDA